jgi:hypothetical protein
MRDAIALKYFIFGLFFGETVMQQINSQKDSNAWIFQSWAAFFISIGITTTGIVNLPVDAWVKGFMGMGLAFSVGSTFSLAKTQRDLHESNRMVSKIEEAKVEQILAQHGQIR